MASGVLSWDVATKSHQIQIRVTAAQKQALKALARRAGVDSSTYLLTCALPSPQTRLAELVTAASRDADRRFALAELNDVLSSLPPAAFAEAVDGLDVGGLDVLWRNYVAAMIEQAAHQKGVAPPRWTRDIAPLDEPYFAAPFPRLRPYLLRAAPAAFKRRNLFVDAAVGDRV